jgi:NADH:ubiquinone oxidoreductase subunit 3 (subunit A)
MTPDHLRLLVFLVVAVVFPLIPLLLARLWFARFNPPKPSLEKNRPYECGVVPIGAAAPPFKPQYYLYGLVFLVFDVEAAFLLPFAAAFLQLSAGACIAVLVFLLLIFEGLVWAWWKGLLRWT